MKRQLTMAPRKEKTDKASADQGFQFRGACTIPSQADIHNVGATLILDYLRESLHTSNLIPKRLAKCPLQASKSW